MREIAAFTGTIVLRAGWGLAPLGHDALVLAALEGGALYELL